MQGKNVILLTSNWHIVINGYRATFDLALFTMRYTSCIIMAESKKLWEEFIKAIRDREYYYLRKGDDEFKQAVMEDSDGNNIWIEPDEYISKHNDWLPF